MAELTLMLRRAKRNNEKKIDLSSRDISFIPNDVYGLSKIEILNLSQNRITSLDQKISELKNLKVLDLSENSLMDLPKSILELTNLQALILDGNPLMKEFEPLLDKNASMNIQKSLRVCFGLEKAEQTSSNPSWFEDSKPEFNSSKTVGKIVEIENQYKSEQKKVKQLEKELQKLTMREKKSNKESFNLDMDPILEIEFNSLDIYDQISMGGFSTIHRGHYKGLEVAVKKIFNPKITEQLLQEFSNEINMLAKFRHPSIVLLVGICSIPPNLAIVTEFIQNGSLYDLLHKRKIKLTGAQRKRIVRQILSAINYLHEHEIVHRDIKSHNFLIDENLCVKLCDFGLARHKDRLQQGPMQFSGTAVYMSQEVLLKKSYDESIDVFALGTLLYEIYSGEIPYTGLDPAAIKEKLLKDSSLANMNVDKSILSVVNECRREYGRPRVRKLLQMDIW